MKTAKPSVAAPEAPPGRRSQPVRQTRTNPPRTSSTSSRALGRDPTNGAVGSEQPIDIFPGVTQFTDAITALPKELVKHFTLLKEVDAKVHVPQQALFQLIDTALRMPAPNATRSPYDGSILSAPASAPTSAQNSHTGTPLSVNGHNHQGTPASLQAHRPGHLLPGADDATALGESAFDQSNMPRRQLFRKVAIEIKEMLVALEEKNHVISTANDALNKELSRIDNIWPHLENEFTDEAKFGSTTHWAYPENRAANRAQHNAQERSRREGAANLSAAAQQLAEEAAARSDARKQAVAARRHQKTQGHAAHGHQDSDADDHHTTKKSGGAKSRKPLPDVSGVGLGISGAAGPSGTNGQSSSASSSTAKRRKNNEKPASSAPMERALSGVLASGGSNGKARTASPRESPVPDGSKKRKAVPANGNQAKKSRSGNSATSSPVIGAFPDAKTTRGSPAPASSLANQYAEAIGKVNGNILGINSSTVNNTSKTGGDATAERASDPMVIDSIDNATGDEVPAANPIHDNSGSANNVPVSDSGNNAGSRSSSTADNSSSTALTTPNNSVEEEKNGDGKDGAGKSAALTTDPTAATSHAQPDGSDNSKQQRPAALALPIEPRQNGSGPTPTQVEAAPRANGSRTPADKAGKDVCPPTVVPVPAASTAAAAAAAATIATTAAVPTSAMPDGLKLETADLPASTAAAAPSSASGAKKESGASKNEDTVVTKKESTPSGSASGVPAAPSQPPTVTTKSGRASKPSTPLHSTFNEVSRSSRPSRAGESGGNGSGSGSSSSSTSGGGVVKRSHKKGASVSSQAHAQATMAALAAATAEAAHNSPGLGPNNSSSSKQQQQQQQQQHQQLRQRSPDEDEEDPLYCYCNRVSFGEMIACDAEDCAREWFHLECVGLRVAPKTNVKWYCDDCKKRLKVGERKSNGR